MAHSYRPDAKLPAETVRSPMQSAVSDIFREHEVCEVREMCSNANDRRDPVHALTVQDGHEWTGNEQVRAASNDRPGYFFCIVGPSGAGKDSLIDAARVQLPTDRFTCATRIITRAPGLVGEVYESTTPQAFAEREAAGEFLLTWHAHGLDYALPRSLRDAQLKGQHVIANGSRAIATQLEKIVPNLTVIEITAPIDTLAKRLLKRGRETEAEIKERLTRATEPFLTSLPVRTIQNDLTLEIGISRFLSLIRTITGVVDPKNEAIQKK